jgi:hypothetical protein
MPETATFASGRLPVNPFATRFVRPGALAPLDAHGRPLDLPALAARFRGLRRAAIEGPHGHGKTTLLKALAAHMACDDTPVTTLRLRSLADSAPVLAAILRATPGSVVCIDSWERLGPIAVLARAAAWWSRCSLLVTSHRPTGMPVLWKSDTTPDLLAAIVARLPDHAGRIDAADIAQAFATQSGNLRESLYDLYDRFEARSR